MSGHNKKAPDPDRGLSSVACRVFESRRSQLPLGRVMGRRPIRLLTRRTVSPDRENAGTADAGTEEARRSVRMPALRVVLSEISSSHMMGIIGTLGPLVNPGERLRSQNDAARAKK